MTRNIRHVVVRATVASIASWRMTQVLIRPTCSLTGKRSADKINDALTLCDLSLPILNFWFAFPPNAVA
jgi:hypothetical protein